MGQLDDAKKSFMQNTKFMKWIFVLWIILAIVLVAPLSIAIADAGDPEIKRNIFKAVVEEAVSFTSIFRIFGSGRRFLTFIGCFIIYTILVAYWTYKGYASTKPKGKYHDIEHGSSDWSNGEQYSILSKDKGILLAKDNYLPLDKRGNINTLIVGGSGSGKSSGYSIPNAYQMLGSYVFTDPKGELYDATAGYLKDHGYEIKVLNLVNPVNSDGYNPLMHVASELDVDVIANTIVKGQETDGKSDPFWDDNAEMLLKSLIYYLIATRPEEEQNLASCAEMVRAANTNGGSNLLTELINQLPFDHPARTNYKNIEVASDKTYQSILSSLQSKLGKFDSKEIAEVTSTDTINFEDIGNKKTALYVISSDTHTAYDFLLTIFFSQMIQQLYNYADLNGGKLKIPVFFILDEFANIGKIPDFDKKISTSRSRGIQFSVILQNLDQLEAVYEKSYETIVGNCDTHVFLGSNSFKTVEYFSKELGEMTVFRESKGVNKDKHYHKQGYNYSEQSSARPLMTPDELRRMDNDQCIIFEKGVKPIKAEKYYYFDQPKLVKDLNQNKISHLNFDVGARGTWRKYNPYNPYSSDDSGIKQENLKVESLDDLFEEEEIVDNKKEEKPLDITNDFDDNVEITDSNKLPVDDGDILISDIKDKVEDIKKDNENDFLDFDDFEDVDLKSENRKEDEEFTEDIQKELEAKFDELFGPME